VPDDAAQGNEARLSVEKKKTCQELDKEEVRRLLDSMVPRRHRGTKTLQHGDPQAEGVPRRSALTSLDSGSPKIAAVDDYAPPPQKIERAVDEQRREQKTLVPTRRLERESGQSTKTRRNLLCRAARQRRGELRARQRRRQRWDPRMGEGRASRKKQERSLCAHEDGRIRAVQEKRDLRSVLPGTRRRGDRSES